MNIYYSFFYNEFSYSLFYGESNIKNSNLPFKLGIDENGNYGYIKDGADTVTPFKSICKDVYAGNEAGTNKNTATIENLEIGKIYVVSLVHTSTSDSMQLKSGATQLWRKSVYKSCSTGAYITMFMIVPTTTSVVFGHSIASGLSYIYAKIEN